MTEAAQLTTTWMWRSGDDVLGLSVDPETAVMRWYDQIGCHCTDEEVAYQSVERFRQEGVPSLYRPLPEDIRAELDTLLATI